MLTTMLQRPELVSTVLSGATSWEKLTWMAREASSKAGYGSSSVSFFPPDLPTAFTLGV